MISLLKLLSINSSYKTTLNISWLFFNALTKKAYKGGVESDVPAEYVDKCDELHYAINEKIAETDEELMEKFFME